MPIHVLRTDPPTISVGVSVGPTFKVQGRGGPPEACTALIDTGALTTAISPTFVGRLRAQNLGFREITRPGQGPLVIPRYSISVAFEPGFEDAAWASSPLLTWRPVVAVAIQPATPGVDLLIGQDLLAQFLLAWDGPGRRLVLSY